MTKRCRRCKKFLGGHKAFCRSCKRIVNKLAKSEAAVNTPKPFFSKAVAKAAEMFSETVKEQVRELYLGKEQKCDLCGEMAHLKKHPLTGREPTNVKEFELCPECWTWWHKKVTAVHEAWVITK